MKGILLTLLLALLPLHMNAKVDSGENKVVLEKIFNEKKGKSLIPDSYIPMRAEIQNFFLFISFDAPISDLTITLYKDGFEVAQRLVSAQSGDTESFDLSSLETGAYSLVMTTESGSCIYGNFLLE